MLGILIYRGDSSEQTKDNMKLLDFLKITLSLQNVLQENFLLRAIYLGNKASIIFSNHILQCQPMQTVIFEMIIMPHKLHSIIKYS